MRVFVPLVLFLLFASSTLAGPVFPTRGFLISPRWTGKVDTTAVFDHASYWAEVQRGLGSDRDRWGWSISMGAIWEFARWGGNKSLLAFTGMELAADTHNDISFNPRGAFWEEGLMYCVQGDNGFDWSVGSVYRCRHDIDNADPEQYNGYNEQRTLIYCSLPGRFAVDFKKWLPADSLDRLSFLRPTFTTLKVDPYLVREDYRIPYADTLQPNYKHLAWSFSAAFRWKLKEWGNNSVDMLLSETSAYFGERTGFFDRFGSIAKVTNDMHYELGYAYSGRAGRIQFYGGYESWEDDGQVPIPQNTHYWLLGVRVTGSDLVTY